MPLIGFLSMKYFLFAQLELSAVGLFSVLAVEISARALSGNGQLAGEKKKKISKENVQLPGKVFRYAELLPPCGIHMSS